MARHKLPVIATNCPPFRDRIISGTRGGWLVDVSSYILELDVMGILQDYANNKPELESYLSSIVDRMEYIRLNLESSRTMAEELDKWVTKDGHMLRYHLDRLSFVLATDEERKNATNASEIRERVYTRLKA